MICFPHLFVILFRFIVSFLFLFRRARPPRYISKIIIAFIWVISLAFAIPMAIALRVYPVTGVQTCKLIMPTITIVFSLHAL